ESKDLWRSGQAVRHARDPSTPVLCTWTPVLCTCAQDDNVSWWWESNTGYYATPSGAVHHVRRVAAAFLAETQSPPPHCHPERNARRAWSRRIACLAWANAAMATNCITVTPASNGGRACRRHQLPTPDTNAHCHPERNARRAWSRRISCLPEYV